MVDRVPEHPGRVRLIPVPGEDNLYDLVREDGATVEGTPLCKGTLLSDDTAAALGLGSQATPNDAFMAIPQLMGKGLLTIKARTDNGSPVPNLLVDGLTGIDASRRRTDNNGELWLYIDEGTYTLFSYDADRHIDIDVVRTTVTVSAGKHTDIVLPVTLIHNATITSTGAITFSPLTSKIDVFVVGGGGGGAGNTSEPSLTALGGGGGGYTATQFDITVTPDKPYNVFIGSGGTGASRYANTGGSGGTTSFMDVSAKGGNGGTRFNGGDGGSGGGTPGDGNAASYNGGNGGYNGSNGYRYDGTLNGGAGQGTSTRAFGTGGYYAGGGGGSAGRASGDGGAGGAGGGGNGGRDTHPNGYDGTPNTGGGGGAGGNYTSYGYSGGAGGAGGSGVVLIRMTFRVV